MPDWPQALRRPNCANAQTSLQPSTPHAQQPHPAPVPRGQDPQGRSAHHRSEYPGHVARGTPRASRSRRGAARRARIHRPRQRKGAGPGSGGFAHPRSSAGRRGAARTRRSDGRRRRADQPRHPAASHRAHGRSAGRGQDHHHRQAGAAADRAAEEKSAHRVVRRLSAGGHCAVADRDGAGWGGILSLITRRQTTGHRPPRRRIRPQSPLRRAARRHRRTTVGGRSHDARNQRAARRAQAHRNLVRGGRHARSGRGEHRTRLPRRAAADRHCAHQTRRRRPRWRGAVGAAGHGRTDQVRRGVGKDRRPGALRPAPHGRPDSGHGRHPRPGGAGAASGRCRCCAATGRQGQVGRPVRSQRFSDAAAADEQNGRPAGHARQTAGRDAGQGRSGRYVPRRARHAPHAGHHPQHDPAGAPQARRHQSHPQTPHRRRRRGSGAGSQPPAQAIRADARHDEKNEGRQDVQNDAAHGRHDAALSARRSAGRATSAGAARHQPALARGEHRVGISRFAARAVVAAQGVEQAAVFDVEVVPQNHAAITQIHLHVKQARNVAIADLLGPERHDLHIAHRPGR